MSPAPALKPAQILVFSLCLSACSAAGSAPGQGSGASRGAQGSAGDLAGGTAGVSGSFGNSGGMNGGAGTQSTVIVGPDGGAVCGAATQEAKQIVTEKTVEVEVEVTKAQPVALYILLDRSGSMSNWDSAAGTSLWDLAVRSITALVNDPKSENIDVALEYFPGDGQCDGSGYDVPSVPIGRLPGQAAAITASLNATMPYGSGTPIEGALRGGTRFCADFQAAHPDEKCVVLLLTDGAPNGCNEDFNTIAAIAGDAFAQQEVATYTVGLGDASFDLLDQIATQGGSDCDPASAHTSCNATTGQLQAALDAVRDKVVTVETHTEVKQEVQQIPLDCEWDLPVPNPGESFQADLLNVRFTPAPGAASQVFGYVSDEAACGAHDDAWHYDDEAHPSRLLACPKTCDAIKAANDGTIEVLLGCIRIPVE